MICLETVDIFCDGSCLDNGNPSARGGWSFVVANKESNIKKFGKLRVGKQTNNRAELEAMLQSLIYVLQDGDKDVFYTIYCDSEITVHGITGKSGRSANRDIWSQIEDICEKLVGRFTVTLIKNDKKNNKDYKCCMNNMADKLAKQGANSLLIQPIQIESEELIC
jgi:ribonuclease HI